MIQLRKTSDAEVETMSTNEIRSNDATRNAGVARIDMKLEVVVIPVSDVDSAKEFYERIGWRLNIDRSTGEDFRLVQFTPPGSCCSVHFGKNLTSAAPGSAKAFWSLPTSRPPGTSWSPLGRGRRIPPRRPGRAAAAACTPSVFPTAHVPYSVIPTATSGTCRRSRSGIRGAANFARSPAVLYATWRARFCVRRSTRGEHEKRTRQRDANWPDW